MELPVLDRFCFVVHLRTGCIAMGIISAVSCGLVGALLAAWAGGEEARAEDAGLSSLVRTIAALLAALVFLKLLLDLVFVWAVHKEKRSLMKKYCIFWIVFLVLYIIGFLKTLFHMGAGYVIAQILFLAENFYYIVVIRSYLLSINEDGVL